MIIIIKNNDDDVVKRKFLYFFLLNFDKIIYLYLFYLTFLILFQFFIQLIEVVTHQRQGREEKKRTSVSLCPFKTQPTISQNSVLDARQNRGGLHAGASSQGLGLTLGKTPLSSPLQKKLSFSKYIYLLVIFFGKIYLHLVIQCLADKGTFYSFLKSTILT